MDEFPSEFSANDHWYLGPGNLIIVNNISSSKDVSQVELDERNL